MSATVQLRRGTAASWTANDPTLAAGEMGFETDTGKFKIGDGSTAWTSLGYAGTAHLTAEEGVQLASGTIKADVSGLSEKVSPSEVTDYLFAYDSSAAGHRKIKIGNLPGGGGKVSSISILNIQLAAMRLMSGLGLPNISMIDGMTEVFTTSGGVDDSHSSGYAYGVLAAYNPNAVSLIQQTGHSKHTRLGGKRNYQNAVAQLFTLETPMRVVKAGVYINEKINSPTGAMTVCIETDRSGPSGTLAHPNATGSVTTPTAGGWNIAKFQRFDLPPGKYWLKCTVPTQAEDNYYRVGRETGGYEGGWAAISLDGGTVWDIDTYNVDDLAFRVEGYYTSLMQPSDEEYSHIANVEDIGHRRVDGSYFQAESFTVTSEFTCSGAGVPILTPIGTPTGTITFQIQTDSGGSPSGSLVHANATAGLDVGDITYDAWNRVNYTEFTLSPGTYWLIVRATAQPGGSYFRIKQDVENTYSGQLKQSTNSGGSWNVVNADLFFRIYSRTQNMDLQSAAYTAEAQPSVVRITLWEEDIDSVTLNTDLVAYVSRDGGTTWTQLTLADYGYSDSFRRVLSGDGDISEQPNGTSMKWRIVSANNKAFAIHGVGLNWE